MDHSADLDSESYEPAAPTAHTHSHTGGHAHSHAPSADSISGNPKARRALIVALSLGSVILVAEVIAGFAFKSLALLGDAAHMLTDVGAYAIALAAARFASRPPSAKRTFGHGRLEILAALINGATLLAATAWIAFEAVRRLLNPTEVGGVGMTTVAFIGLVANAIVLWMLWRAESNSLNMRGAMLHAAGDLLGSVAAMIAGVIVVTTGFNRADPIVSLLLTALIAFSAWRLVLASIEILLNSAPAEADAHIIGNTLVSVDGVIEAHDVHVWTSSPGVIAVSAHVRIASGRDSEEILDALTRELNERHGINHSTLQIRVDRGTQIVEAVPRMSMDEAIVWATEHILKARPELSRGVVNAVTGAAALSFETQDKVSPVLLSQRATQMIDRGETRRPSK